MKLLIVEDELEIAETIKRNLKKEMYVIDIAPTISFAKAALLTNYYSLIVLDRMLPDGDGVSLIKYIKRKNITSRILVLSALSDTQSRIQGLNTGADDYLTKPFDLEELFARIRASLRRPSAEPEQSIKCGNVEFFKSNRALHINGELFALSAKELSIFEVLISSVGKTVLHEALEQSVYSLEDEVNSNTLSSHISRMRKMFDAQNANISIHVARGIGYILKESM